MKQFTSISVLALVLATGLSVALFAGMKHSERAFTSADKTECTYKQKKQTSTANTVSVEAKEGDKCQKKKKKKCDKKKKDCDKKKKDKTTS